MFLTGRNSYLTLQFLCAPPSKKDAKREFILIENRWRLTIDKWLIDRRNRRHKALNLPKVAPKVSSPQIKDYHQTLGSLRPLKFPENCGYNARKSTSPLFLRYITYISEWWWNPQFIHFTTIIHSIPSVSVGSWEHKVDSYGISSVGRKKFREHLLSSSGYWTSTVKICTENFR